MSNIVKSLALAALLFVPSVLAQSTQVYMTEPSFSPDRKEIAFVSGGDIWPAGRVASAAAQAFPIATRSALSTRVAIVFTVVAVEFTPSTRP